MLWAICFLLIFLTGAFGGFLNALMAGELHLPKTDNTANVWRPGWLGNVLVGGAAALVFWGLYGPFAEAKIIGAEEPIELSLTVAELFGSLVTGIGGGRLLTNEVERRGLQHQNVALKMAKDSLGDVLLSALGESSEAEEENS